MTFAETIAKRGYRGEGSREEEEEEEEKVEKATSAIDSLHEPDLSIYAIGIFKKTIAIVGIWLISEFHPLSNGVICTGSGGCKVNRVIFLRISGWLLPPPRCSFHLRYRDFQANHRNRGKTNLGGRNYPTKSLAKILYEHILLGEVGLVHFLSRGEFVPLRQAGSV